MPPPPTLRRPPVGPAALLVPALAALALVLAACGSPGGPASTRIPGGVGRGGRLVVDHVVDGDTLDVALPDGSTERVRLLGVDTPETVKPNTPVQCFGPEASARTKALLPHGTAVLAQRDAEGRDRYGRLLLYLWRADDGLFVNASLVADGFARTLSIAPNTSHRSDLAAAQDRARAAALGLWGSCPADPDAPASGGGRAPP